MALVETANLVFGPDYQFFSIRDYDMYDKPGAPEALKTANTNAVAGSKHEVFVVCAQDVLKISITVLLYDDRLEVDTAGRCRTRPVGRPGEYLVTIFPDDSD